MAKAIAAAKPNIVFFLADDLGYGDVSCYGAKAVRTPAIDQLAREGVRFTSGYCSASICTPTRSSVLTGTYAFRQKGTGIAPPVKGADSPQVELFDYETDPDETRNHAAAHPEVVAELLARLSDVPDPASAPAVQKRQK